MIEAKPENLIGDRAYDSDLLDETLHQDGIEMIAPHRSNRSKPPTQDRQRLSRYLRRCLVERFFAWIQWHRRILSVGSIIPKTSSVSSSSPTLLSCSGSFEIGSREVWTQLRAARVSLDWSEANARTLRPKTKARRGGELEVEGFNSKPRLERLEHRTVSAFGWPASGLGPLALVRGMPPGRPARVNQMDDATNRHHTGKSQRT
jgi:hypothetical protein